MLASGGEGSSSKKGQKQMRERGTLTVRIIAKLKKSKNAF